MTACEGGCTFPVIDFESGDDTTYICGQEGHGAPSCLRAMDAEELRDLAKKRAHETERRTAADAALYVTPPAEGVQTSL